MHLSDAVLGVLFFIFGSYMAYAASGMPAMPGQPYGASLLPSLLGFGFIICGVLLMLREVSWRRAGIIRPFFELEPDLKTKRGFVSGLLVLVAIVAQIFVAPNGVGYVTTSVVTLFMLIAWQGVKPLHALFYSVVASLFCWYVFSSFLRVPLARGPLEGLL